MDGWVGGFDALITLLLLLLLLFSSSLSHLHFLLFWRRNVLLVLFNVDQPAQASAYM
jgi:hypothetical protein